MQNKHRTEPDSPPETKPSFRLLSAFFFTFPLDLGKITKWVYIFDS